MSELYVIEQLLRQLIAIEEKILAALLPPVATDLHIEFGSQSKEKHMASKKTSGPGIKCPCLTAKSGGTKAVMPGVTLTSPLPASLTLQPVDASGNPVALQPTDSVTATLTSDSAIFAISQGPSQLQFVGTIPANTPQGTVANLAATLNGTIQGAAADLTASVQVTIDVPPAPVAVDLQIIFG